MRWSPKVRWGLYGLAGAMTLAAMRWVDDREGDGPVRAEVGVAAHAAVRSSVPAVPIGRTAVAREPFALPVRRGDGTPSSDPFMSGIPPAPDVAPRPAEPAVRTPVPPPPLSFRYLGKWEEGGKTTVFVADAVRSYTVTEPGPLGDHYRVESIGEQQLVLQAGPRGPRQILPFRTGPAAPAFGGAGTSREPDSEEGN